MLRSHDWIIPTCGGRPWLERPPLPHWITALVVVLTGEPQAEWPYRLSAALAGTWCVLLVGWVGVVLVGRRLGLLGAILLAATQEFCHYATAPECDVFLCAVITSALAAFVRAEFVSHPCRDECRFWGRRPWPVLAFFVLLGLTNLAKGLFFGMTIVLATVGGFLLSQRRRVAWRPYVWLWGWLACAATAAAWPLAAWLRHSDVVELWGSDYLGRLQPGYMTEPGWYYLAQLPWCLFPVTPAVIAGVFFLRGAISDPPRRHFLLCWALLPLVVLSLARGKHHHYLLHALAPWAIMAAPGVEGLWRALWRGPAWLRSAWKVPLALAALAVPAFWLAPRLADRVPLASVVAVVVPILLGVAWWAYRLPDAGKALAAAGVLLVVGHAGWSAYQTLFLDNYRSDRTFIHAVPLSVPESSRLLVLNDSHPLDSSWPMFYLPGEPCLLHNLTFLHDERLREPAVHLIARLRDAPDLRAYGDVEIVQTSASHRSGRATAERWALYRLSFRADLWRGPADLRVSPMQATGRAAGPFVRRRGSEEPSEPPPEP
jgi:4-amino-4-deoxy-L-arabinose transferase-like glycosyltransferase